MPPHIFVVDDEPPIVDLLADILQDEGYAVTTFLTGAATLLMLNRRIPDLLIVDVRLADMDGSVLCGQIKANPITAHVPIIMLSALSEEFVDDACHYAAFLDKPFDLHAFLRVVQQTLAGLQPIPQDSDPA